MTTHPIGRRLRGFLLLVGLLLVGLLLPGLSAAEPEFAVPRAGGPFEGAWSGEIVCAGRDGAAETLPVTARLSQGGDVLAALVSITVVNRSTGQTAREQTVFLSRAPNGASPLDVVVTTTGPSQLRRPVRSVVLDPAGPAMRITFYGSGCQSRLSKVADRLPADVAEGAPGLVGVWATPSPNGPPVRTGRSVWSQKMSTQLEFRRDGTQLYGQIRASTPPRTASAEQGRLAASLRPLFALEDGRIGFTLTERTRADGVFGASTGLRVGPFGLLLLVKPAAQPGRPLEAAVMEGSWLPTATLMLDRRREGEVVVDAPEAPARELPPGLGGQLAAAGSLPAQCDALADWGRPFTSRPDAAGTATGLLVRETLPLFADDAFVPTFGLPYAQTTPPQRRLVFSLLQEDCAGRFGAAELARPALAKAWTEAGGLTQAGVTSALTDAQDAWSRISATIDQLAALPQTRDGLAELPRIEQSSRDQVEKLDGARRTQFADAVTDAQQRIAGGVLLAQVADASDLPASSSSLGTLQRLLNDLNAAAFSGDDKASAIQATRARLQAMVQSMVDDLARQAIATPTSLVGLSDTNALLQQMLGVTDLAEDPVRLAADAATQRIAGRRAEILADAGVLAQFRSEMVAAGQRGGADGVQQAAARFLLPQELAASAADSPYSAAVAAALRQVGDDRRTAASAPSGLAPNGPAASASALAGSSAPSSAPAAPPIVLTALTAQSGTVEPSPWDLLDAVEVGTAGSASPGAAGDPARTQVSDFRKLGCQAAADGAGYLCSYTAQAGSTCSGRFVASGVRWLLQDRRCQ